MLYKEQLFQLDTTVSGMLCVGLLDSESPCAWDQVNAFAGHLPEREFAALFHMRCPEDGETRFKALIASRRGWLVSGLVLAPENVKRSADGVAVMYDARGSSRRPVLAYGESLEKALSVLVAKAKRIRLQAFATMESASGDPGKRRVSIASSSAGSRRHIRMPGRRRRAAVRNELRQLHRASVGLQ